MKPRQRNQAQGKPQRLTKVITRIRLSEANPGKLAALDDLAPLSERWHRVAIQQAAGIAQSWRTKREYAHQAEGTLNAQSQEPFWTEWDVPTLRKTCIQANAHVVVLEPSHDSAFDYWLKISTLELGKCLESKGEHRLLPPAARAGSDLCAMSVRRSTGQ